VAKYTVEFIGITEVKNQLFGDGSKQRLEEMEKLLNEQSTLLEEYDEQLVRRLIEKITVYDDKLTIEFKSGVEVDV
jgi:site-specific DNA recombinase